MVCERLEMFPVECVARGYLAGSGLPSTSPTGDGLRRAAARRPGRRLAAAGADLHAGHQGGAGRARRERALRGRWPRRSAPTRRAELRDATLAVYAPGRATSRGERGIVLADTKLELGRDGDGRIVLADEVLTPDSSRFWPADQWEPGHAQPSFDKQFVRDWLTSPASRLGPSVRRAAAAAARRRRRAPPGRSTSRPTSG